MKVNVCSVDDFPAGSRRKISAGGREIVVFNIDGAFVALDNQCAHKGLPLAEGVVRDGVITCPAHLWRYEVVTGERVDSPGWSVRSHPVAVDGTSIVVDVPEPAAPISIREQLLQHAREWDRDR